MLQMLQMLRCVVKSEKAAIAACATCATPLISVHSDANHSALSLPSPHPSPCHAHLPNYPPAPSLPLSHATNATRRSGKEKFIDDKHETKIAFQLLCPKQPSSSSSSSSSSCCCPAACLPWQTSPLPTQSQKTPKCAAKSAEKRKIVQTTTRQMPKPSPADSQPP